MQACQSYEGNGYLLCTQDTAVFGNGQYSEDLTITYTATGGDGTEIWIFAETNAINHLLEFIAGCQD